MNDKARSERESEVRQVFAEFCRTWTVGDAEAFGDLFTEDADYVSFDGSWAAGRVALRGNHEKLFRGVLAGSAMVGSIEAVRFVADDVAVAVANGSVLMPWRRALPKRRLSRQTMTFVNTADGWRIVSIQNGRQRPVVVPDPESLPSKASRAMTRVAAVMGVGQVGARGGSAV